MRKRINVLKALVLFLVILMSITTVYADDYPDDIYDGDYSIEDMLQNYSVVTFGKKYYDENSTILKSKEIPGSLRIFHIVSNFIVRGNIDLTYNPTTPNIYGGTYSTDNRCNMVGKPIYRVDCKATNNNRYSYYGGFKDLNFEYNGCSNGNNSTIYSVPSHVVSIWHDCINNWRPYSTRYSSNGYYISIDRLYDNVIEKQSKIKKGKLLSSQNNTVHIETGGEYYIEDINSVESIIFDNFENNENKLTVITINNEGAISFPKIYDGNIGGNNLIPTNDMFNSTKPNSSYPGNYVLSKYKGNIIWNIPNARYIELPSAPFIGHLIAPNADVEGPELHYAGAFLVNSLALEGNSEAHFYPLQITDIPYKTSDENYKAKVKADEKKGIVKFNNNVNPDLLEEGIVVTFKVTPGGNYSLVNLKIEDEEKNEIEYKKTDDNEYEFTMPATDVTIIPSFKEINIIDVITNPKTGTPLVILVAILIILVVGTTLYRKKESKKI